MEEKKIIIQKSGNTNRRRPFLTVCLLLHSALNTDLNVKQYIIKPGEFPTQAKTIEGWNFKRNMVIRRTYSNHHIWGGWRVFPRVIIFSNWVCVRMDVLVLCIWQVTVSLSACIAWTKESTNDWKLCVLRGLVIRWRKYCRV